MSLSDWLGANPDAETKITLSPTADITLKDLTAPSGTICLLVGAEGGLTEDEISLAATQGFKPIKLGKRILRTETAPLAAISAMQTLWGDFCV
jgi:16S rRNA (uracil1498-N3)-methyltransferase